MSNILDYLDWRGDLAIDRRAPFCEVDNLILTQLSFIDLVGIRERDFEAESETVGGWTIEMFGSFPSVGDSFDYEDLHITVLEMDRLRVEKVLVVKKPPEVDPDGD